MSKTKNELVTLNTTKAEKLVAKFHTALNKVNTSAWGVAKVAYETVTAKDFKETFGTLENYAESVGYSKANISKLVKAYKSKVFLQDATAGQISDFTTSQIMEMAPVEDVDKLEFIDIYNIDNTTTVKDIRECVKNWRDSEAIDVEATEVDAEPESENAEPESENAEPEILTVTYNGDIWQIFEKSDIDKILKILGKK